jgi:hypothetical protein
MRVPDRFLKSVCFVMAQLGPDLSRESFDPQATGFFVAIPSKVLPGKVSYVCFVTARHVVEPLIGRSVVFTANRKGGGIDTFRGIPPGFIFHPDPAVDLAVIPADVPRELDISPISIKDFVDRDLMFRKDLGVGDDVFITGLFTHAPGVTRNTPIVRHGNLAMIPEGPIQTEMGFAETYLIEARSIGRLSGSPVFIRRTVGGRMFDEQMQDYTQEIYGVSGEFYLLGMAQGHWDIRESEINEPSFIHDRQRGVNMGIAMVVPAHKIMEILNLPILVRMREAAEAKVRASIAPGMD